jgi:8-amino-7-oxononanoate synthase
MLPDVWRQRLQRQAKARQEKGLDRSILPDRGWDFCSNDYLGLRKDPRLVEAGARAARVFGAGTGAARLLGGTSTLHDDLEFTLARWKGTEACLLFNTGYQANITLIPALVGAGDAVFSDALNHASLVDGCRLAKARGAQVGLFRHLDLDDLARQLREWRASAASESLALVATDALFSMDGDAANLSALVELCEQQGALLLVDEAHATGLLGSEGAGLAQSQGVQGRVPLLMGTLGKALGAFGAFVCCEALLREHLVNTARGFIFSTALPPSVLGSALEGIRLARSEPWRREKALSHAAYLRAELGLPGQVSAIVPVPIGPEAEAVRIARSLQQQGFDVRAVRPPSVPPGTARLRITTGAHQERFQVEALATALKPFL